MTKRLAFFLPGCIALLFSCRNDAPRDISDYYFPLEQLKEGLVYEYRAHDTLTPVYWYYRALSGEEGRFLLSTYYEQELEPLQLVREEVTAGGALLHDLRLYSHDASGMVRQTQVEIEEPETFPFQVRSGIEVAQFQVNWTDEEGQRITVVRDRRFAGDTTFVFQGKTYPAVLFALSESIVLAHPKYGTDNPNLQGREGYAKGLGLVFFEKAPVGTPPVRYTLHRRYPMEELENLARQ